MLGWEILPDGVNITYYNTQYIYVVCTYLKYFSNIVLKRAVDFFLLIVIDRFDLHLVLFINECVVFNNESTLTLKGGVKKTNAIF